LSLLSLGWLLCASFLQEPLPSHSIRWHVAVIGVTVRWLRPPGTSKPHPSPLLLACRLFKNKKLNKNFKSQATQHSLARCGRWSLCSLASAAGDFDTAFVAAAVWSHHPNKQFFLLLF
jgi:hypothetical protein